MKTYDVQHIKNVALLGHSGSGKTTLAESMLFESGTISRRGTVEERNTVSDYTDIEHERGSSVFSTMLNLEWRDYKINIIDTPGYDDFIGEVVAALRVADTGVIVLSSVNGVEVGTELIWRYTEQYKTPTLFAVNKLDMEQSKYDNVQVPTPRRQTRKTSYPGFRTRKSQPITQRTYRSNCRKRRNTYGQVFCPR